MTSNIYRVLAVVAALSAGLPARGTAQEKPAPVPVDGLIEWVYDYQEGQRISLASGRPMFVVFRCER